MNLFEIFQRDKLQMMLLVLFLSLFSTVLVALRVYYTSSFTYLFLIWNLFLAGIPFVISLLITTQKQVGGKRFYVVMLPLLLIWLMFLPNAFYIITDLFHLRPKNQIPLWYDLLLLLSFAWTGLVLGYLSLIDIHELVERRSGKRTAWLFAIGILVLCAFGVYLGRYLRWNSWDLFTRPNALLGDVYRQLMTSAEYLGVTIGFSIFFLLGYLTFRVLLGGKAVNWRKD